jgi:uncharacterized protein (TIGR02266 family)
LVIDYDGADDLIGDYAENLSTGGTFVRTERELSLGTPVQLLLSFPALVRPIRLDGVVRWARPATSADGEPGIAIEFTGMAGEARLELDETIAAIERRDPGYVGKLVRVLVAEDNPHMARLIREGLPRSAADLGDGVVFEFCETADGREALALCRARPFQAAIIDIYLPVLDGATLIRELRADPHLRELPIIAVSAGGELARKAALEAGADLFLGKPMRLRQVVDSMRALLDRRRSV